MMINLLPHQEQVLNATNEFNRVAFYLDMGLGKTFVGSEKLNIIGNTSNLVVCQKSKVNDWLDHFNEHYPQYMVVDGTKKLDKLPMEPFVIVVNYDIIYRREWVKQLKQFTLMLDESSMIKNDTAKRTKAILKLNPSAVILLSGTPTGGKYEELYSQLKLLGWTISKTEYLNKYTIWRLADFGGVTFRQIIGYKNVDELNQKLREYGAVFMKTEEVLTLPKQNFIPVKIAHTPQYKRFMSNSIVNIDGVDFVGDNTLKKLLYARQLCSIYNDKKLQALGDILESTNDRVIIFYNFNQELDVIKKVIGKRPYSVVNGSCKDLTAYQNKADSIVLVQYQAGAMGLNLQEANTIVYFSPTLSSDLYEQSKKRIHRIGQNRPCFYYQLISGIEERIYKALAMRKDYTDELFRADAY